MIIRRFNEKDAKQTAELIAVTLRKSNSSDYTEEYIEETIKMLSTESLIERAKSGHMYIVSEDDMIVGCGAITGYWGSLKESILLTIFVRPEYQKRGIGKKIMETLEKDEIFLRSDRVEIPASITACEFYKKMGYTYKDGITHPDEEGCIRLEKLR